MVLTGSLTCDPGGGTALLILGPANVVARGFSLTCGGAFTAGIRIEGERVNLVGGRITGCFSAVVIASGGGQHNLVKVAVDRSVFGFEIFGNNNQLVGNAANNSDRNGFGVFGDGNRLVRNRAQNNFNDGIAVSAVAQDNSLVRNTVLNNGAFDLRDDNADCDNNRWIANIFNTRNQECIQ